MKNKLLLFSAVICVFFFRSLYAEPSDSTESYIDKLLNSAYKENEPGISVLISEKGNTLYKKAFGLYDLENSLKSVPENVYAIGSMTKQFTSAGILILQKEGKLNVKDDIKLYLPGYNNHGRIITIENLMTHTSGIPSFTEKKDFDKLYDKKISKDEIVKYFQDDELLFEPGADFSYSNSGYFLLGLIIEKISGMSYEDFIQKNIFDKAGMINSCFGSADKLIPMLAKGYEKESENTYKPAAYFDWSWLFSAGNIISSTGDLIKWNEALKSGKIIPKGLLDAALTPFKLKNGASANYGYGLNVTSLNGYTIIKHGGAINGYLSDGIYIPEREIFIAALSDNTSKIPDNVTNKILLYLLGINQNNPVEIDADKNLYPGYVGAYEINREGARLLKNLTDEKQYRFIFVSGDSLMLQRTGGGKYKLIPYGRDKYFISNSGKRFEFIRDSKGEVTALEVSEYPVTLGPADVCNKTDVKLPEERKEAAVDEEALKKFTGEYELHPGFNLNMFIENGVLFTQATGQQKIQLYPESENKFFMKVVDAQIEFVTDSDGTVNKLILTQGQKFECKRIK